MVVVDVQIRNDFARNVVSLGIQQVFFNRPQLNIPIHRIVQRGTMRLRRFLCDMRDHPFFGQVNIAGILMHFAAQQREQARFTATVRPDQADFVSGENGEVGRFDETLGTSGEGEIGDSDHWDFN